MRVGVLLALKKGRHRRIVFQTQGVCITNGDKANVGSM